MTTKVNIVFGILLSIFTLSSCNSNDRVSNNDSTEITVYDRVIKNKKIRAAYISYPPACMKDTKTGEMSGIFVEVLEEVCDNLDIELEWTEEVDWAAQIAGLESNRYDIVGSPVWANPVRGKLTSMSTPIYYSGIGIYVREQDTRFDNNYMLLNSPNIKIGTVDGETSDIIAREDFPEANRYSSTQLNSLSEKFLDLTSKKTDAFFTEPFYAYEYEKNNPNTIKNIALESPIRIFGNCYMFKEDENQMKHMLDVAIQELHNSGFIEKIIKKYEPTPNLFYRVVKPYEISK